MEKETISLIETISPLLVPFWQKPEFWISFVLGFLGIIFTFFAYLEARKAKNAAQKAARIVNIQNVYVELIELNQKINHIGENITHYNALIMHQEVSNKLLRILAPFSDDAEHKKSIINVTHLLKELQTRLRDATPINNQNEDLMPNYVYYEIRETITNLSNGIASIAGELETRIFNMNERGIK